LEIHKRAGNINGSVRLHAKAKAMKPASPARVAEMVGENVGTPHNAFQFL
jgi:hypothetical protein